MCRAALAVVAICMAITASAGVRVPDLVFRLTGWAEIPSTYRRPGPVSGQFTTGPVNGVTPPYAGQPIPGFSGMIPTSTPGTYYGFPITASARRTTALISHSASIG